MNNSTEMIWSVDRQQQPITFNRAFSDEYTSLIGTLPAPGVFHYKAFGPDGETYWKQKVDDALKGNTVIFEYSYEIAGRVKHTHVFMCPIRNGEAIEGTTCFMVDITTQKKAVEIQQRQFEELQQLYNLARLVDREDSLEKIYDHAMDLLTGGFKADRCSILLFDADGIMRFEASRGISAAYRKAAEGHSPWKPGTKNPLPIFVEDVAREESLEPLREVIRGEGIKSLGFIPLICRDQVIGKFMIYYNQVHRFNESEKQFVQKIAQDIAVSVERKRSEEQLQSQYSLLTALINSPGNIIIFSLNKNYCYTAYNECHYAEMKKVWNVDIKVGMNLLECISKPEIRELAKRSIDRTLQGEAFTEIQQQSGLDIYYEFSWNPVFQNNKVTGATVFIQDITRRKQAEGELEESREKYRGLSEATFEAIFISEKGLCVEQNQTAEKMFGYTSEEAIGRYGTEWIAPRDREMVMKNMLAGYEEPYEATALRKDGTTFPCLLHGKMMHYKGRNVRVTSLSDITERKQAEQALKESENNLKGAQRLANIGSWELDHTTNKLKWSDEMFRILEKDPQTKELTYEDYLEMLHPDDRKILNTAFADSVINKTKYDLVHRIVLPGGRIKFLHGQSETIYNGEGKPIRSIGTGMDITQRKLAEEQTQKEKELSDSVINSLPGIFYLVDSTGKFLRWNKNFEIVSGYNAGEIANMHPLDFTDPDERGLIAEKIGEVFQKGSVEVEANFFSKDGKKIPYFLNGWRIEYEKKPCLIGVGIDSSKRRQAEDALRESEQRFRLLLDSTAQGIYGVDMLGNCTFANTACLKFLGYGKEEDLLGQHIHTLIHHTRPGGTPYPVSECRMYETLRTHSGTHVDDECFWRSDGSSFPVEYWSHPIFHNGQLVGAIASFFDITERKQAEEALKESERLLRESQAIAHLGNYVWDISTGVWKSSAILDEILGIDENYDRSLAGWRNLIHPDWLPLIMDYISTTVLRNRQRFDMEFKIIRQNTGQECWVSGFGELEFDGDGQPQKLIGTISDINERKQAGEALQESKNILRAVLDNAPIGIWMQNSNGQMLFVNQKFCSWVGISEDRFIEAPHYAGLYTPEVAAACIASDKAAIAEAGLHISHEQLPFTDGKIHDVEIIKVRITEKQNGLSGLIGLSLDITERKQAEEKLRESEQKYRSMIERNLAGIYQTTIEGKILTCNDAFAQMLGYNSHTELLNKNARMLYFSDADRNKLISILQKDGELNNKEITLKHKDGSPVYLFESCILVKDALSGEVTIEGVILDITKRKKAEEQIQEQEKRYRALVDSAPDAIVIADEKGIIQIANMQAEKLFGYTKAELTGMAVEMLMPRQHRRRHKNFHREFIGERLNRPMGIGRELIALRKDGLVIPVEISLSVFDGAEGVLSTASIRDITQRKKAEKELEESYQSVRLLTEHLQNIREEERSHIAREIHDELGQQLTVMKMDVSWLSHKLGKTDEAVGQRTEDLKSMLDQTVITVRRIAADLRPGILDDMGLGAAIEWQLSEFEKRSGVKTEFDKMKREPPLQGTVKTGLFRIVQESLTNISRYAKAKKVTVNLGKKGKQIVLVIKDNGTGFDIGKIASKKTLGILGMRERSFMMGGTYEINSAPGKGTVVTVIVPFKE